MKKIFLTGITAALFGIAAIAQERTDTTRTESNQLRDTEEQVEKDVQEGVNEVEQEADEAKENVQQEGQELHQDAEQAGDKIENEAEQAGDRIEEGAERTGDQLQEGADKAGEKIEQAGDQTEQAADQTLDNMNSQFKSSVEGGDGQNEELSEESRAYNTAPELEVVEDKEGPNSEVVYKYQDEYFYVDRDEKKVVKAKESELQNAKHHVIVKEGEASSEDASSSNRQMGDEQKPSNSTQPTPDQN